MEEALKILSEKGVVNRVYFADLDIGNTETDDTELEARKYLISLGFKVKTNHKMDGSPDMICMYGDKEFYVEVKREDDLRATQIKWILNHPDKKVIVLTLRYKTRPYFKKV